jgi:transposase InsO family protein
LKAIYSDNGTEFWNASFDQFCLEHDVDQQFSTPRVPKQNGVVQRKNHTIVEMAKMMLDEHRTPRRFWTYAITLLAISQINYSCARFCIGPLLRFALVESLLSLITGLLDASALF